MGPLLQKGPKGIFAERAQEGDWTSQGSDTNCNKWLPSRCSLLCLALLCLAHKITLHLHSVLWRGPLEMGCSCRRKGPRGIGRMGIGHWATQINCDKLWQLATGKWQVVVHVAFSHQYFESRANLKIQISDAVYLKVVNTHQVKLWVVGQKRNVVCMFS